MWSRNGHTFDRDPMVEIKSKNSELLLYIIFPIWKKKQKKNEYLYSYFHI
jgi:hypothetical protein